MMGWKLNDLTAATGAPLAIFGPSAYMFVHQGTQHVVYQGFGTGAGDGHVHELWWNDDGWHHSDLTADCNAPLIYLAPWGYAFEAQGTQHVVYQGYDASLGYDGRIHEIWWDDGVHHSDLTNDGHAPPMINSPFGYEFSGQNVVYEGNDFHIHYLSWNSDGSWTHTDLNAATGAGILAQGPPIGYGFNSYNTQHVLFQGTDNHIHEFWGNDNQWAHNDLTLAANAPLARSDLAGYASEDEGLQLVHYSGTDDHIHQLWWDNAGWHHLDLTAAVGGPAVPACCPIGYVFPSYHTQHVLFSGSDDRIHEFWRDGNGLWHHNDLSAATGAPRVLSGPVGYVFAEQGTQHVFFIAYDHRIIELYWVPD